MNTSLLSFTDTETRTIDTLNKYVADATFCVITVCNVMMKLTKKNQYEF